MLVYKKEVPPEPFTLGITHAKLLALGGYLWCTISTFVLKYSGVSTFIILNMWPSCNCSTLSSIRSKPTVLNLLAPKWNIGGAFTNNQTILFWLRCILHFISSTVHCTMLNMGNLNYIESKMKLVVFVLT